MLSAPEVFPTLFFSYKNHVYKNVEPQKEIEIATSKITTTFLNFKVIWASTFLQEKKSVTKFVKIWRDFVAILPQKHRNL